MESFAKLIPECNLAHLEAEIATLNKRCRRLKLPEITLTKKPDHAKARVGVLTVHGEINKVWMKPEEIEGANKKWPHKDTGERMVWWAVEVTGESPKLNGWEFIAVLEPMETDDGAVLNLIQCLPGKECPTDQRTRINICDHCHANRRRKQTFVVFNAERGEYKSVGRQCIKDFMGYHADVEGLIAQAEMLASLFGILEGCGEPDEEEFGGHYRPDGWDLETFLELTACRIRLFGWLGAGHARDMGRMDSTKNVILEIIGLPPRDEKARKEWEKLVADHTIEECDKGIAKSAIEWAREIPNEKIEGNDYLANINLIARVGAVSRKTAGVAASIVASYHREGENELKRQEFARRPESFHIGEIGKRIPLMTVKCEKIVMNETAYGVTGIHKMTTTSEPIGSDLTWFASQGRVMEEGQTYHIAATVKAHDEYKGRKQTIVTRVAVLSDEEVAKLTAKAERKTKREAKRKAKQEPSDEAPAALCMA